MKLSYSIFIYETVVINVKTCLLMAWCINYQDCAADIRYDSKTNDACFRLNYCICFSKH